MASCAASLALLRPDRGVHLEHQPVLWLGRLERGRRRTSLRFKGGLDELDHGFKLLVRQVLERIAVRGLGGDLGGGVGSRQQIVDVLIVIPLVDALGIECKLWVELNKPFDYRHRRAPGCSQ
jgi:hypothetical protein